LVYKDRLYRAIEFLLLFDESEKTLPTCDSKPQGLLRLISDSVPFEFVKNLMDSDGNTRKYKDIYEFFKRIAAQTAEFDTLTKAARRFSTSFGGAAFAASERNHQHHLADTEVTETKTTASVTKASASTAVVPYQRWPRKTIAVMESVLEEGDEKIDPEDNAVNDESEFTDDDAMFCHESPSTKKLNAITASDKLGMACFRMVTRNSCQIPNCEYSHDSHIVGAARDKQMAEMTEAKRAMQSGHQATLRQFDKQGAKALKPSFQPTIAPAPMRPVHTDTTPRLSLLSRVIEPIVDQHIGQEDVCFRRIDAIFNKYC